MGLVDHIEVNEMHNFKRLVSLSTFIKMVIDLSDLEDMLLVLSFMIDTGKTVIL